MDAKDLMIGDWVSYNDKMSCKITALCKDRPVFDTLLGYQDWSAPYEKLKPIPLTPEILEKNFNSEKIDFEGRNIETLYTDHNEFYEITISEYTGELWEVEIDEIEFSSLPIWKMYVCNVHELQHALRLCGIDKEIIV